MMRQSFLPLICLKPEPGNSFLICETHLKRSLSNSTGDDTLEEGILGVPHLEKILF